MAHEQRPLRAPAAALGCWRRQWKRRRLTRPARAPARAPTTPERPRYACSPWSAQLCARSRPDRPAHPPARRLPCRRQGRLAGCRGWGLRRP
eukprot:4074003-Prymnesium_polylepis.1